MSTNFYFDNFNASQEQLLLEDLIIESIKIYGIDVLYIPRRMDNIDKLYGTDANAYYDTTYPVEMYVNSVDGFSGDGNFMSKFGLEIRDQIVFTVAKRIFYEEVDSQETPALIRPREGDLIYFPLNDKCFQIKYVNNKPVFYPQGSLPVYEMTCELFEYSSEIFKTGIEEIDRLQKNFSMDILDYTILTEDGNPIVNESQDYIVNEKYDMETIDPFADNNTIQKESDGFLDFSQKDPFSEGSI